MIGAKLVAHDEQDVADFAHALFPLPRISVYLSRMNDASSIRDILDFWFLALDDPGYGKSREVWWKSTPGLDADIAARFTKPLDRAAAGELDCWAKSPDGALALIVLCDQFSRNIHRRTARAFATDPKALGTARIALACGFPAVYPADMRLFFYMPFQHSESLGDQQLCCDLFASLGNEDNVKFAIGHRDIVARFGRFPHRNEVLGRRSTAEELDYLKTAERFGQ
jgi:uncharacterized protein (DUF924 family)